MSSSIVTEAGEYWRTRILRWRIGALWLLLMATALTAAPTQSLTELAVRAGFLALAMCLLRLWDDLADLEHDRIRHPERTLVASAKLYPYVTTLAAGLVILALVLIDDGRRLAIYGVLLTGLTALYHTRPGKSVPRPVRAYLVVAKYPLLVVLAGVDPSVRGWLAGLLLYALLVVIEWREDGEIHPASLRQVFIGSGAGAVLISAILFASGGPS